MTLDDLTVAPWHRFRDRTDVAEGGRPDWCPLELGPVTVEVEK